MRITHSKRLEAALLCVFLATSILRADEAQIRELIETWAKSVRAKDIDGTMAHHAPDILLFDVPPPVQSRGVDEYRKSWERFFSCFMLLYHQFFISGEIARLSCSSVSSLPGP